MSYEIQGTLVKKGNTETKGESFQVRTFGIKINDGGKYENYAGFQLTQDRCALADGLKQGDEIKVHFDVRGRLWGEGDAQKVFTNLNAWKIEKVASANPDAAVAELTTPKASAAPAPAPEASDDLPF